MTGAARVYLDDASLRMVKAEGLLDALEADVLDVGTSSHYTASFRIELTHAIDALQRARLSVEEELSDA